MDVGRIVYITVIVMFVAGGLLSMIFGRDEEPKPPPPELDLADVPHWDDEEETRNAKLKRTRERWYGYRCGDE